MKCRFSAVLVLLLLVSFFWQDQAISRVNSTLVDEQEEFLEGSAMPPELYMDAKPREKTAPQAPAAGRGFFSDPNPATFTRGASQAKFSEKGRASSFTEGGEAAKLSENGKSSAYNAGVTRPIDAEGFQENGYDPALFNKYYPGANLGGARPRIPRNAKPMDKVQKGIPDHLACLNWDNALSLAKNIYEYDKDGNMLCARGTQRIASMLMNLSDSYGAWESGNAYQITPSEKYFTQLEGVTADPETWPEGGFQPGTIILYPPTETWPFGHAEILMQDGAAYSFEPQSWGWCMDDQHTTGIIEGKGVSDEVRFFVPNPDYCE